MNWRQAASAALGWAGIESAVVGLVLFGDCSPVKLRFGENFSLRVIDATAGFTARTGRRVEDGPDG